MPGRDLLRVGIQKINQTHSFEAIQDLSLWLVSVSFRIKIGLRVTVTYVYYSLVRLLLELGLVNNMF